MIKENKILGNIQVYRFLTIFYSFFQLFSIIEDAFHSNTNSLLKTFKILPIFSLKIFLSLGKIKIYSTSKSDNLRQFSLISLK